MSGTGAPKGNQYAKKERPGRTIGLYITPEELAILEASLTQQEKKSDKISIDRYARSLFKQAVRADARWLKEKDRFPQSPENSSKSV